MGLTSVHQNSTSITIPTSPYPNNNKPLFFNNPPSNLTLPRVPLRQCVITLARRRSSSARPAASKLNKSRNPGKSKKDEDVDEDAFDALFKQLEEDLKKDGDFIDDDNEDDISEEDLALLERELGEALSVDEDLAELLNMHTDDDDDMGVEAGAEVEGEVEEDVEDDADDSEEDTEEEMEPIKLRSWQFRRLAYAMKVGRRKISVKKLAAELCLDRAILLQLLREPPPNLLMLSAALPDKQEPTSTSSDTEVLSSVPSEEIVASVEPESEPEVEPEPEPKTETPIHVLKGSWSAQKRLKKVQVETLENVYRRTKRPTNTVISSIVHVTNLPRRRVVKWFEDKRTADGVPEEHIPYRRSASETVVAK